MSQRPDLSHHDIRQLILDNVDPIGGLAGVVSSGGRLNAQKALEQAIATHCGDVDDDGLITAGDVSLYRNVLAGAAAFTLAGVAKCTVIGAAGPCSIADVAVLKRRVEGPDLPPAIAPVCAAAGT